MFGYFYMFFRYFQMVFSWFPLVFRRVFLIFVFYQHFAFSIAIFDSLWGVPRLRLSGQRGHKHGNFKSNEIPELNGGL